VYVRRRVAGWVARGRRESRRDFEPPPPPAPSALRRFPRFIMSTANQRLRAAAKAGDVAAIGAALRGGADVHSVDKGGYTALLHAATGGHLDAFRTLLASGADVRALLDGKSVVRLAIYGGNAQLVREAVAAREAVAPLLPPLHRAAAVDDNGATVRAVLAAAADASARATLLAARCDDSDRGGTALHIAAACGNAGAVAALLEAGAGEEEVDALGDTPLHVASMCGNVDVEAALSALMVRAHNNHPM
jgi:ankyrin repeat protein